MGSGRKKRIMIACVTFETTKVTEPVDFYEINKLHIIHYVRDPSSDNGRIYQSFYDRVVSIVNERSPRHVDIVEHNEKVSDFSNMLRTVLSIIRSEKAENPDCDIYVNISSGTSEYAAASAIASMMVPETIPFSVGTSEYTIPTERIPDIYYIDGEPVGLTKSTFDPRTLPSYSIDMPEEHLVRGLRILDEMNKEGKKTTSGKVITRLKDKNVWYRDTETSDPNKKSTQRQTEAVYYQRDFINKWLKNEWIEKDELRGSYILTEKGRIVIDTFYV